MKKFLLLLALSLTFSTAASAFSIGDVSDAGNIKMKACLTDEAKKALVHGELTSKNVDKKAAEIAAICAASSSMEVNPEVVKQASTIIKSML